MDGGGGDDDEDGDEDEDEAGVAREGGEYVWYVISGFSDILLGGKRNVLAVDFESFRTPLPRGISRGGDSLVVLVRKRTPYRPGIFFIFLGGNPDGPLL